MANENERIWYHLAFPVGDLERDQAFDIEWIPARRDDGPAIRVLRTKEAMIQQQSEQLDLWRGSMMDTCPYRRVNVGTCSGHSS